MEPQSVGSLERARMIIHGCLERDYCKANSIDTTTHFTMMRPDFERYRDRFQSGTAASPPSIDRCVAIVAFLMLSCFFAACSWYAWIK
jgi:hypothetical protein